MSTDPEYEALRLAVGPILDASNDHVAAHLAKDYAGFDSIEQAYEFVERAAMLIVAQARVDALRPIECEIGGPNRYHFVYGGFPGGDPRRFEPDEECCTKEEIARHAEACKAWDEGRGEDRGPGCQTMGDAANFTGEGFGIGTYEWDCDLCSSLVAAEALLARVEEER